MPAAAHKLSVTGSDACHMSQTQSCMQGDMSGMRDVEGTCTLSWVWPSGFVMTASTGAVPCTQDSCKSGERGMLATPSSVLCWNLHMRCLVNAYRERAQLLWLSEQ